MQDDPGIRYRHTILMHPAGGLELVVPTAEAKNAEQSAAPDRAGILVFCSILCLLAARLVSYVVELNRCAVVLRG